MELKLTTKLNERQHLTVTIDGKMDDCLRGANALLSYDGKCGLCKSGDITLQTKIAKGFKFIEFVCACGGRAQWGQYKEGGYFLKKWEHYAGQESTGRVAPEETKTVESDLDF